MDRHDQQIAGITKLLKMGIRQLYEWQGENRRTTMEVRKEMADLRKEVRALATAQRRTEASLDAFIASMRRGGNGHGKPS